MKSLFLAIIFSSLFAAKSKAQNAPTSVTQAFSTSFPHAIKTNWTKLGKIYKAEFVLDNVIEYAFFSNTGEFLVLANYIQFQDLPYNLRLSLVKQFPDHKIIEIFKTESERDMDFFATLEKDNVSFILQSVHGKWQLFKNK
jgi:hypothetical protein